jgi:beta-glucosidase
MTTEEKISQLVNHAPAIPRLGVQQYDWWNEGLHGVAWDGTATVFPEPIGLAATWDSGLIYRIADAISTEARAKHAEAQRLNDIRRHTGLTYWSPNINIDRDPRWGRGMETYGEDPFLTATLAVQFVRGLQGNDPHYLKVVATPKHFAVHSGPEPLRHGFNVDISKHDLVDTYLPAFRAAITDGGAESIMCAYNAVDGEPACANDMLLQQYLRTSWGFHGYVVSDCDAVADIARGHHAAPDNAHAAALAIKAGTDLNCGRAYQAVPEALKEGLINQDDIDRALIRLFTARFRLGMFDPLSQVKYANIPMSENHTAAHRELSLQASRESIVLLKNDGILPLKSSVKHIAVIGPSANSIAVLEGNYNGTAADPIRLLDGIRKEFAGKSLVDYAPGSIFAAGVSDTIPSTALRTAAGSSQRGLTGEYFDHPDFDGAPKLTRVDPDIDFDWNRVSPAAGIPASGFAVRWRGEFVPPMPGDYVISFRGKAQSYHVYLDGNLVLNGKGQATLSCANTKPHAVKIEYVHSPDNTDIGFNWQPPAEALLQPAVQLASKADVVVALVGLSPNLEGEEMNVHAAGFNGGDRTSIELPEVQEILLRKLKATGKPMVVVLTSGSAIASPWLAQNADALLEAWYGGECGGQALAEVLSGAASPGGRLPITFYRATSDLPPFDDYSMQDRTYRYYRGSTLYRFGFGLSYTKFRFGPLNLSSTNLTAGTRLTVRTTVTNIGVRSGDEVLPLFLVPPSLPGAPLRQLVAFKRLHLGPGKHQEVSFVLSPRQLSLVQEDGTRAILAGEYGLALDNGTTAMPPPMTTRFRIHGTSTLSQ